MLESASPSKSPSQTLKKDHPTYSEGRLSDREPQASTIILYPSLSLSLEAKRGTAEVRGETHRGLCSLESRMGQTAWPAFLSS